MDNKITTGSTNSYGVNESEIENTLMHQAKKELEPNKQIQPPEELWQKINSQIKMIDNEDKASSFSIKRKLSIGVFSTAASLFLVSMVWLMWSNHQLQNQLKQVIITNQYLELQLEKENTPSYYQTKLITQIRELENELLFSHDDKEMLSLLIARKKIMQKIVELQKEENHEYSI
ncbi:MAG: hypothetical protein KC469_11795 [Flavobacteriaceae bacterium]|nr:hypothetical protein [Flavobacteriaceae bacterium]